MKWFQGPATPRTAALVIILFFVAERAASVGYLLPGFCVEDERWIQEGAIKMVREGTLDPGTRKYPGLMFELTAGVYYAAYLGANATAFMHFDSPRSRDWHRAHYPFSFESTIVAGRLLVMVLAGGALWMFWTMCRREWGDEVAVLAVFLLATCPGFLFVSQVLKNDALVIIGGLAATAAGLRIYERGARRDYLLAGAALGLCLAAKYHFIAMVPLLLGHRLRHSDLSWFEAFRRPQWLLIFAFGLLVFAFLSPYSFLDLSGTVQQGMLELAIQNRFDPLLRRSRELWWHWPILFQLTSVLPLLLGIPLYLLSLAGLALHLDLKSPRYLIFFSYPAALLIFMMAFSELGVPHLYAPAAPFFALAAAWMIAPGFRSAIKWKRAAGLAGVAAVAGMNLLVFHGFTSLEQNLIVKPAREMATTHRPGQKDIALVPYFANPDLDWPIEFYPQFFLNPETLRRAAPDRILLHHTFYNAYLNHRELTGEPQVAQVVLAYLDLRNQTAGYREEVRWDDQSAILRFYAKLFPDFAGLRSSIYVRQKPES